MISLSDSRQLPRDVKSHVHVKRLLNVENCKEFVDSNNILRTTREVGRVVAEKVRKKKDYKKKPHSRQ